MQYAFAAESRELIRLVPSAPLNYFVFPYAEADGAKVQMGKKDGIAHWPFVMEEFAVARSHYEKLGIEESIQIDLHEGGHEPRIESGVKFLVKWLIDGPQPD